MNTSWIRSVRSVGARKLDDPKERENFAGHLKRSGFCHLSSINPLVKFL